MLTSNLHLSSRQKALLFWGETIPWLSLLEQEAVEVKSPHVQKASFKWSSLAGIGLPCHLDLDRKRELEWMVRLNPKHSHLWKKPSPWTNLPILFSRWMLELSPAEHWAWGVKRLCLKGFIYQHITWCCRHHVINMCMRTSPEESLN